MAPLANLNFLSPDSRCYPFDARANGYSRGEGFGVIIVKRVTDAIADGDTIRAVIRGIGANQDGRTPGITQPSCAAQESMIRETYENNGLDLGVTRFFEAHGTGTPVGDLVEARAVGAVFKDFRTSTEPLFIGAAKSNIGHLEGASGIASIIKVTLALEKGIVPPNADFRSSNPEIPVEQWNIKVFQSLTIDLYHVILMPAASFLIKVRLGRQMGSEELLSILSVTEEQMSISYSMMLAITSRLEVSITSTVQLAHLQGLT